MLKPKGKKSTKTHTSLVDDHRQIRGRYLRTKRGTIARRQARSKTFNTVSIVASPTFTNYQAKIELIYDTTVIVVKVLMEQHFHSTKKRDHD